jgi:hypothetical protein
MEIAILWQFFPRQNIHYPDVVLTPESFGDPFLPVVSSDSFIKLTTGDLLVTFADTYYTRMHLCYVIVHAPSKVHLGCSRNQCMACSREITNKSG